MTLPELSAAELLPCPNLWCNDSKPTIVSRKGESREYHNVFCDTCDIGPSPSFHSRSEAIAAWNTRTNQLVERDGVDPRLAQAAEAMEGIRHVNRMGITGQQARSAWGKVRAAITAIKGGDDVDG